MVWIRRRYERRRARRAARLLVGIAAVAGARRTPDRSPVRASIGTVR